ncbi:MAG: DUF86 domain-containing protein [Myxococcales bacterium]|nr:DUF86 domain-containing protein [Myxococcales bacterium]
MAAKLTELSDRVARVRASCPDSAEGLAESRDALDLVSFNLMLAVQVCADLASHVIADEGWPAARGLAEGFARLEEHGILSAPTAAALSRAVGLRNVVAHGHAGVDTKLVFTAAKSGLSDLEAFATELASWVNSRPGS